MTKAFHILITGAGGQVGMAIKELEKKYTGLTFYFAGKAQLSITDSSSVSKLFEAEQFTHCINCAAYTAVDKAETERDLAFQINAVAPGNLAAACKKYNTGFIHISTDYVFDGNAVIPYHENAKTNPLGIYGVSKLAGEEAVLENNDQSIIIRTSWVYSRHGKNFVKTMMRLMNEKDNIAVVNDQFGSPTYAPDLAEVILKIVSTNNKNAPGLYHYSNSGVISWYDFAVEIKHLLKSNCTVNPIETSAYPTLAKRPRFAALDTAKIKSVFSVMIPDWKVSLKKCIALLSDELSPVNK